MSEQRQMVKHEERVAEIAQYDPTKYNILAPISIVRDDVPYVRQRVAVVKLDPDPEHGDCYPAPGARWAKDAAGNSVPEKVAPAKAGLMKLAAAMGIVWKVDSIPPKSHRLAKEMAAGLDSTALKLLFEQVRYDCAYRAVIAVRDGLDWRYIEATYEWELDAQTRKIRREARKRAGDAKKYNKAPINEDEYVQDRLDQVIAERFGLAESKAILRAIRATGIRHQYTREEFAKAFVVQRTEITPDYEDPEMRKALAEKAMRSGAEIFGGAQRAELPAPEGAGDQPDFEAAQREGRFEQAPPLDEGEEVLTPDVVPDQAADAVPGPWDDGPAEPGDHGAPSPDELKAQIGSLWAECAALKKAGRLAAMPTQLARDADLNAMANWIAQITDLLVTVRGQGGAA